MSPRQRRDHQPVPRRDDLVVEMGPRSFCPHAAKFFETAEQLRAGRFDLQAEIPRGDGQRLPLHQNVLAREFALRVVRHVAAVLDAKVRSEERGVPAQLCSQFSLGPDIERALGVL